MYTCLLLLQNVLDALDSIEAELDRQVFLAEGRAEEDSDMQAALNARLLESWRDRDGFDTSGY